MNIPANKHPFNILLLTLLIVLAYLPGLSNFFISDDIPNIVNNTALQVETLDSTSLMNAATANDSGPLKRPIASLSFGLNYYFSGGQLDARDFKITNLAIHILNSILVYFIAFCLISTINIRSKIKLPETNIAIVIALVWALHPIQLTAVLYVVQRMTSLSAFFLLAGLLLFIIARTALHQEKKPFALMQMYIGVGLGTLLGALCKENALLLPYLALAIELIIFNKLLDKKPGNRKKLTIFYILTTAVPAVLAIIYLAYRPELMLNGYIIRDFTLAERLMTETRVLFIYISQIPYPALHNFTLYHDNIEISRSLFQPWSTLAGTVGVISAILFSLLFRKKHPVLVFAILWFFTAHAMESSIFPLVLMYEHRNYLPTFGIIFAAGYYGYLTLNRLTNIPVIRVAISISIILCLTALTHVRSEIWSSNATLSYFNVKNNPDSAQAHASRASYLLGTQQDEQKAYKHLVETAKLSLSDTGSLITMMHLLETFKAKNEFSKQPVATPPMAYYDPLIINEQYIKQLSHIINLEINSRLLNSKLFVPATAALWISTDCAVKEAKPYCLATINNTFHWLKIALNNTTLPLELRSRLRMSHARINAYQGNIDAALKDMEIAYEEAPKDIYLLIEKLNLLINIHDWENAAPLIQKIETNPATKLHHRQALKVVKRFYNAEYAKNQSQQSIDHQ